MRDSHVPFLNKTDASGHGQDTRHGPWDLQSLDRRDIDYHISPPNTLSALAGPQAGNVVFIAITAIAFPAAGISSARDGSDFQEMPPLLKEMPPLPEAMSCLTEAMSLWLKKCLLFLKK